MIQQIVNQYNENNQKRGYWEEYWPDGKLFTKGHFNNGKREGYWERYWKNGNLSYKGHYVNGKEDGYWESYYPSGKLAQIFFFIYEKGIN